MKTIRFSTKIVVAFGGILLIVSVLTAHAVSPLAKPGPQPTLQDVLNAIATLQGSVNNMPPAWYQILPSDQRFLLVMGDQAVLDRETGLVWEKSPSTGTFTWEQAQYQCNNLTVGNRKGWRLPTIQELASLVDPTQSNPALPAGHPFSNVQSSSFYWSATTFAFDASGVWVERFNDGGVGPSNKSNDYFVWFVRGGQGVDSQ